MVSKRGINTDCLMLFLLVGFNSVFSAESKSCDYFSAVLVHCDVSDDVIFQMALDLVDCSLACIGNAICRAISYLKTDSTCKLHSSCPKACNGTFSTGWVTMCKEQLICTELGQRCEEAGFSYVNTLPLCYTIFNDLATYDEAVANCSLLGSQLLGINNHNKEVYMEHILRLIPDSPTKFFIDGKLNTDQYYFSNGDRISDLFWFPGANYEGKECLSIHATLGGWKDVFCAGYHGYICEMI